MSDTNTTNIVWDEFSDQIRRYLLGKVKLKDDADDLLQEIFIKIHNNINQLEDESKLAPWIHQIVRNTLTDYYRKNNPETVELNEESTAEYSNETDDLHASCISGCLRVFIERLPDKYKVPLELSDITGSKQKDIAQEMGLSYSGLKSRVQRGRQMIKDMFVDCACVAQDGGLNDENCEFCSPATN
ncbi:MAG: RNA polymerase sigma factor SigZ [Thermodesulfobacteriota bacterium]